MTGRETEIVTTASESATKRVVLTGTVTVNATGIAMTDVPSTIAITEVVTLTETVGTTIGSTAGTVTPGARTTLGLRTTGMVA